MHRYRLGLILGAAAAVLQICFFLMIRHTLYRVMAISNGAPTLRREHRPVEDFTYRTLDGQVLHASALRGKVVFVNVWGTWCPPCVREMPTVQKLYEQYRADPNVAFVIAAARDTPDKVRAYERRNHMDLPFYYTQPGDIPDSLRVRFFPTTLLYAKDGTVAAEHMGRADWSAPSVAAFIAELEREPYVPPSAHPAAMPPNRVLTQLAPH